MKVNLYYIFVMSLAGRLTDIICSSDGWVLTPLSLSVQARPSCRAFLFSVFANAMGTPILVVGSSISVLANAHRRC
jgi:hypothetical protein